MSSERNHILLFALLLALLSIGLGVDWTFARINDGLSLATSKGSEDGVFVTWSDSGPELTSQASQGRYFPSPSELEQVHGKLPVSLTLLEYKDSRTVVLLRLERWNEDGLLSAVYEGHQKVAVPIRSSLLPMSDIRAAIWSGICHSLLIFFGVGIVLGLMLYLGGRKEATRKIAPLSR